MNLYPTFELGLWNAWIFMSIFIMQMFVIMFYDKKIWEKSNISHKSNRKNKDRYVGYCANLFWLIAMIYSIFLPLNLNTIWFYCGIILFLLGIYILIHATYNFIKTPHQKVITKGVYRISRHPMYLATFLIMISVTIVSLSWIFLLLTLTIMFFFNKEAVIEEKHCRRTFGKKYEKYQDHTSRWIGLP